MSVMIRGMKMPKDCRECPFEGYHVDIGQTYCMACLKVLATAFKPISFDGRLKWCPLVELPKKHGRLIDADELMNESRKDEAYGYVDTKQIYDAPTVIEAEDEE